MFYREYSVYLVLLGVLLCMFRLLMVSSRFLHVLLVLEQLKGLVLMCSLVVGVCGRHTYFIALLVLVTVESMVCLLVMFRSWRGGKLVDLIY